MAELLAELRDVQVHFPITKGIFRQREVARVRAVDGVSLGLRRGQVLGLVGESGSGKSTTGRALLRLAPLTGGQVLFDGQDISTWERRALLPIRRRMQVVFQDPEASLNPRMRVGESVAEPMRIHTKQTGAEVERSVAALFEQVGLSPELRRRYPHEFSGGQRQRIGIARALATSPELLVLDEPISALDVSIQAQVLNLLADLRQARGLSYLFIAHDLGAVAHLCDTVAVMYLGRIVEHGDAGQLFGDPRHPYTRALLASVPIADPKRARARGLQVLGGEIPSPLKPPSGCAFHPRCPMARPLCSEQAPALREVAPGRRSACHFAEEMVGLAPL